MKLDEEIQQAGRIAKSEMPKKTDDDNATLLRIKQEIYDQCAVEMMRNVIEFGLRMEEKFADADLLSRAIMSSTYNMVVDFCAARFDVDPRTLEKGGDSMMYRRRRMGIEKAEKNI